METKSKFSFGILTAKQNHPNFFKTKQLLFQNSYGRTVVLTGIATLSNGQM